MTCRIVRLSPTVDADSLWNSKDGVCTLLHVHCSRSLFKSDLNLSCSVAQIPPDTR